MLGRIVLVRFNREINLSAFLQMDIIPIFVGQDIVNTDLAVKIISSLDFDLGFLRDARVWRFDDLLDNAGQRGAGLLFTVCTLPRLGGFQFGELVHEGRDVLAPLIYHLRLIWGHSQEDSFFQAVILQFEKGVDLLLEFFDGARRVR